MHLPRFGSAGVV